MIKKNTIIAAFILFSLLINAQEEISLYDLLWEQVQPCYSVRDLIDGDPDEYFTIIDDAGNGYLSVHGGIPGMGYRCSNDVGAFTNNDGTYTIINQEFEECKVINEIISNRDLKDVFPENFGMQTFLPDVNILVNKRALFYIYVEVPQVGTDMKVSISPIPFGLIVEGKNGLSFGYREADDFSNCKYVLDIHFLIEKSFSSTVIKKIMSKDYDNLPKECIEIMDHALGDEMPFELSSYDEFSNYLNLIKQTYNYNQKIVYDYIILSWSVEKSRFYIKEKHKRTESISFKEFVEYSKFWLIT